jgi:hypothetical protein
MAGRGSSCHDFAVSLHPTPAEAGPLDGDAAARKILAANALTILVAWLTGEGLLVLLWPYWAQSIVIGWYAQRRIRLLQRFSTEGFRINDQAVAPTPETRTRTANFFLLHYGFFHLGYLVFLLAFTGMADPDGMVEVTREGGGSSRVAMGTLGPWEWLAVVALAVGFWHAHRASHHEHVEADLRGRPNIGTLMFLPYARIIPMHLTIILGAVLGSAGVVFFGVLKTAADLLMHTVEHRLLRQGAPVPSDPG